MTADLSAAGLIGRPAAAHVSGMPEDAADDGPFGPAGVAWRVSADLAWPVAGLRSLLMQALRPLAMAGLDQHSGWRRDPAGGLAATSAYLATVTFGERAVAEQAAAWVRRIHEHVRGVDAVTGRRYAAGDPALCCGCTRHWSSPARRPPGRSGHRRRRRTATATSRR
jgi:uncharacterized protein (DUF2236 family)